jgi:hypothetical protein
MEEGIKFTRICQPLNKYTFKAPKIKAWVEKHLGDNELVLNLFAGPTRLDNCRREVRVDLDPEMKPEFIMDALDFVRWWKEKVTVPKYGCLLFPKFNKIILDPPYSYRKSMELYKGNRNSRFKQILDILPDILAEGGQIITFGYHSSVMSKKRGFKIVEICLFSHGGAQRDTLSIVEDKLDKLDGDTIATVEERIKRKNVP